VPSWEHDGTTLNPLQFQTPTPPRAPQCIASLDGQTDGQTNDSMMPIGNHTA